MQIDPPAWELHNERCGCCYGRGELIFSTCPTCSVVVLICSEVGTSFEISERHSGSVLGGSPSAVCAKCGRSAYGEFRSATSDEILALGFQPGDYGDCAETETETRELDPDEIPLPAIAQKDGGAMTLRCRTPGEAYLICDELEKEDIVTILPEEEELLAEFKRNGYVEVRVSARTYESLASLKSTVEFQYKRLRSERPLSPFGKILGLLMAMMILPGVFVFAYLLTSYRKNGYLRMASDLKVWFSLGIVALVLFMILCALLPR